MTLNELIGAAISRVAGEMPEGWSLKIEIGSGTASVFLYSADGKGHDFPGHGKLWGEIHAAVDYAQQQEEG